MRKLIAGLLLSLFSVLSWAEIQVQVQPSQINMGETFKLSITQNDPQNSGLPDLTSIQQDFEILGTERHVNYSIINGQAQSNSQWIITLRALKSGILTIPSIKIGSDQSTPLTINVQSGNQGQSENNSQDPSLNSQDIMLITEVDGKKPYVNEQVIYTVKLYFSKRFLDTDYQGPKVDNALLIPLGDAKRYQEVKNDITYVVEEQNYAIYPQKSGNLKIISPTFSALVYDYDPQRIKAQDKAINLMVQPIPKQYQGKLWLPAKRVSLTETYENSKQTIDQGSTLTRTVKLEGVGIPAQLLPTLDFEETDAFSVYPEKGADRNQVKQGELVGSTEIKVTYLFNKSGKVIIPELRLHWFNTETGKDEVAVLPPRSFEITPSAKKMNNNLSNSSGKENTVSQSSATSLLTSTEQNKWPWLIALLFACAWIITLALWLWQKRPGHSGKRQYKNALDELNKACAESNPKKARDAVLKWATLHWPDAPVLNLTDLARLVRDAHLKKQLNVLSQVLYQSDAKALWRGDELLRAVYAVKRNKSGSQGKTNVLPPINPF